LGGNNKDRFVYGEKPYLNLSYMAHYKTERNQYNHDHVNISQK